jgi:hypothetical protein
MEIMKGRGCFLFDSFISIREVKDSREPVLHVKKIEEQIVAKGVVRSTREKQKNKYLRCISKPTGKQRLVRTVRHQKFLQSSLSP